LAYRGHVELVIPPKITSYNKSTKYTKSKGDLR